MSNLALEQFKAGVLGPAMRKLNGMKEDLRSGTLRDFRVATQSLITELLDSLIRITGMQYIDDIPDPIKSGAVGLIVSGLNGVLPLDYPFIITIREIKTVPGIDLGCILREDLPGAHDILSRNIIPIVYKNTVDGPVEKIEIIFPES